jgi:hypothetical protein
MSDESSTLRARLGWIASVFHPERKIATATLAAIKQVLTGRRSISAINLQANSDALAINLADVPELGEVGGIARVTVESGEEVGIARVGRTSFVGYRLEADVLKEIDLQLDEAAGKLKIVGAEA